MALGVVQLVVVLRDGAVTIVLLKIHVVEMAIGVITTMAPDIAFAITAIPGRIARYRNKTLEIRDKRRAVRFAFFWGGNINRVVLCF